MYTILILFLPIVYSYNVNLSLMRHGLTKNNVQNIWTGELDVDLNSQDEIVKNRKFDLILSSTQNRCRQTVNNLILDDVPDIMYNDGFNECGYGDLTGMPKDYEIFSRDLNNKPPKSNFFKSESIFDGGVRAFSAYNELLDNYTSMVKKEEYNVLVVSHKNTMKGLWFFLHLDEYINDMDNFDVEKTDEYIEKILKDNPYPNFENSKIYDFKK